MSGKLLDGGLTIPQPPLEQNSSLLIPQIDGNISFTSTSCINESSQSNHIPVHYGLRPKKKPFTSTSTNLLKTIKRDNKLLHAANLPKIV